MSYIETVMNSSTLTIKHGGKNIRVPSHVFQMAKDHAANVCGIMGDLSKIKNSVQHEKTFKEAFEGYLEGYFESMYPAENPKNRAKAATKEFDLLSEKSKFFTQANFPGLDPLQLENRKNAFKSGVFNLNDVFLEGVMGKVRQKDMPYQPGSKTPETKQQKIHRYYQLMSVCWILSFCEKIMSMKKEEIARLIGDKLVDYTEGDLQSKEGQQKFVLSIKKAMNDELAKINLYNTLK